MGTTQRLETEVLCRDGLSCSSEEASVMEVERRGQVIQYHNIKQSASWRR